MLLRSLQDINHDVTSMAIVDSTVSENMPVLGELDSSLMEHFRIPLSMVLSSVCAALVGGIIAAMTAYRHLAGLVDMKLQTYIVRIVFIVPIYVAETISILFFGQWIPGFSLLFIVIRDIWEAIVIDTFLSFVLESTGGEGACARAMSIEPGVVSHLPPLTWCLPADGITFKFRTGGTRVYVFQYLEQLYERVTRKVSMTLANRENSPPAIREMSDDTEYSYYTMAKVIPCTPVFVKWCKRGTLQFVITKPIMAFLTVLVFLTGLDGLVWHWFELAVYNISYSVALYSLCLFYTAVRYNPAIKPVKPLRKFVAVKLVVFATFWQNLSIACLGMINNAIYYKLDGKAIGIGSKLMSDQYVARVGAILLGFELPLFAAAIAWAYPVDEFSTRLSQGRNRFGAGASSFGDPGYQMEMNSMVELEHQHNVTIADILKPLTNPPVEVFGRSEVDQVKFEPDDCDHLRKYSCSLYDRAPPSLCLRGGTPLSDDGESSGSMTDRTRGDRKLMQTKSLELSIGADIEQSDNNVDTVSHDGGRAIRNFFHQYGYKGEAWDATKAKRMILGTLNAPKRIGETVVYGMVESADQGKRDQAKKNLTNVLNLHDIMDEVRVNFAGKYFEHSLINGEPIKAQFEEPNFSYVDGRTFCDYVDDEELHDVFDLHDPFDLHSFSHESFEGDGDNNSSFTRDKMFIPQPSKDLETDYDMRWPEVPARQPPPPPPGEPPPAGES